MRGQDAAPWGRRWTQTACVRVLLCALATSTAVGCKNLPATMQGQVSQLQQQGAQLAQQNQELTTRASTLDEDNQELSTLLAQSQQQNRLLSDQVGALREQLGDTTSQLARLRDEYSRTSEHTNALAASLRKRAGASISANSSLGRTVESLNIPGVEVRKDGDVLRIELPGNRLFAPGSARLVPDAAPLIDRVAAEILRVYPKQVVGVEGHTDNDPIQTSGWSNNHQLSTGRAMAVYDHLVGRSGLKANQLFVVGHGQNHPVVSNASAAGKERNRRVELVVYPDNYVAE